MNMFSPIGNYYMSYDSPYVRSRNEQLRRRGEAEAALRRSAEMEYYQQMEHEERERRRQEVMRRRLQQEEHMRWKQHEMQRREEEKLRIHEKRLRQQEPGELQWEIVRGPDGRLYRVALDPRDFEGAEKDQPRTQRKEKQKKVKPAIYNINSAEEPDDTAGARQKGRLTKQSSVNVIKPRRKRVTIVVEDASDSEMEDELIFSPWRNRPPSPGQWIEPIDFA